MHDSAETGCTFCSRWQSAPELQIADFDYSCLILNPDQFFPGYCLLFTKEHATELFHLSAAARHGLMEEVNRAAAAIASVYEPDKINYELLGNMVPHIHWHLIPRFRTDPLWPRPVWSEPHTEKLLAPEMYRQECKRIRKALENI